MRRIYIFMAFLVISVSTFIVPCASGLPYDVVPPKYYLCCDVNYDGKVDMKDVAIVAKSFGSTEGSSNWNFRADINRDGKIDMVDIALVCGAFGEVA